MSQERARELVDQANRALQAENLQQALELAEQALVEDPENLAAQNLAERISREMGDGAAELSASAVPAPPMPVPPTPMPPEEEEPEHSIPWVASLGTTWVSIGWVIAAISVVAAAWVALVNYQAARAGIQPPRMHPVAIAFWIGNVCTTLFIVLDVVDRRRNVLWVLPGLVCCCVGFLVIPIYMVTNPRRA